MTTLATIVQKAMREGNLIPVGATPTANQSAEAVDALNQQLINSFGFEMGEELTDWLFPAPQRTDPVQGAWPQMPYPAGADSTLLGAPLSSDPSATYQASPPANSRVIWGQVTKTLFFPEQPNDGSRMGIVLGSGAGVSGASGASTLTLDGNGRQILYTPNNAAPQNTQTISVAQAGAGIAWIYRADLGYWLQLAFPYASTDQVPFPLAWDDYWGLKLAFRLAPRYGKVLSRETNAALTRTETKFMANYRQIGLTTYKSNDIPRALESYISGRWFY